MNTKTKTAEFKSILSSFALTALFVLIGFAAGALISLHLKHTVFAGAANNDLAPENQLALGAEEAPEQKNIYREGGCGCPACCSIF